LPHARSKWQEPPKVDLIFAASAGLGADEVAGAGAEVAAGGTELEGAVDADGAEVARGAITRDCVLDSRHP